jgi:aspartate-semialdehyde dehydrogenase
MSAIAVVHPMTLVGKELRDRLEAHPALATEVRLYATDEAEVGTVTDAGGAAGFVNRLDEDSLEGAKIAFFCGEIGAEREILRKLPEGTRAILLSRGAGLEDGVIAAPDFHERDWIREPRLLSPAPATLLLAKLLAALVPAGIRTASATVVLPVSGYGQAGLDALYDETRALLTFSGHRKSKLFGSQAAFNLFPGEPSGAEIERQVAALAGSHGPKITVQTAQGGIFHGVTASVLAEGGSGFTAAAARARLAANDEFTVPKHPESIGPVDAAGDERILIGETRDAGEGRVWIWSAMDNLTTGGAINALRVADIVLGAGAVQ